MGESKSWVRLRMSTSSGLARSANSEPHFDKVYQARELLWRRAGDDSSVCTAVATPKAIFPGR